MTSKQTKTPAPADKPKAGRHAAAGAPFNPRELPEESAPAAPDRDKGMPAPGVPMSDKTYELMKKRAKDVRTGTSEHAQEDSANEE